MYYRCKGPKIVQLSYQTLESPPLCSTTNVALQLIYSIVCSSTLESHLSIEPMLEFASCSIYFK